LREKCYECCQKSWQTRRGWDTAWDTYLELSKQMPQDKSVQFPEFREEMIDGWRLKKGTFFAPGGARPPGVYMLPDRFRNIF